jgi:hypothetical protein
MTIEMVQNNASTTREAIAALEQAIGLTPPSSYRTFLLATNGGRPVLPTFPITNLPLNPLGSVNYFFGITSKFEVYQLAWQYHFHKGRIPAGILLIAGNAGSDFICLDLRNKKERVVFWDYAHFWSTGEWRESDLYFIANSFEAFLKSLRPNPY